MATAARLPAVSSKSNASGNAVRRAIDLSERLAVAVAPASSAGGVALIAAFSGDEAQRLYETLPTTLSRVVPASRATMAVRARVKRLNSELLPTLAWPMMATVGSLLGIIMLIIPEAWGLAKDNENSPPNELKLHASFQPER